MPCRSQKGPGLRLRFPHFFDEELASGAVGGQTCDYRQTATVADEHAHLASDFESCMQVAILPLKILTADDLQKPHDIGRLKRNGGR